jgi:hypothetical protein
MDMRSIQEFCWPAIKDADSAKKAADQGFIAAILFFLNSLQDIFSEHYAAASLGVLIVAICGYGTRRMSRVAAVAGLVFILPGALYSAATEKSLNAFVLLIICLLFFNSIRGTFAYPKLSSAKPLRPTVEALPPEPPPPREKENPPQA